MQNEAVVYAYLQFVQMIIMKMGILSYLFLFATYSYINVTATKIMSVLWWPLGITIVICKHICIQ